VNEQEVCGQVQPDGPSSEWTDEEREKSWSDLVVDAAIEEYLMAKARRKRENQHIG
jgi:hypothetical protein